ncbi:HPr family phosphocarrier protein [Alkaliphilus peptidifermentans]|uniref:Phosphocarrier protein HPr n=1 Tax=Alkaliphilus peptidifermentans DSM 18978 TaxID=1120976 RepID=A0A1G5IT13_9FIRM|nr:HPr family phosphocarrier protein [Alkaliphilus peptidifermentans]SCY78880.1 phosphocarrier protein [Alkaliphilus peptidifermentans DSM 18978]
MLEGVITIKTKLGIHARPASVLVKEAAKFNSDIFIIKDGNKFNAKSIMNLIGMAAKHGDEISIRVSGTDEEAAFEAITAIIKDGLGE